VNGLTLFDDFSAPAFVHVAPSRNFFALQEIRDRSVTFLTAGFCERADDARGDLLLRGALNMERAIGMIRAVALTAVMAVSAAHALPTPCDHPRSFAGIEFQDETILIPFCQIDEVSELRPRCDRDNRGNWQHHVVCVR